MSEPTLMSAPASAPAAAPAAPAAAPAPPAATPPPAAAPAPSASPISFLGDGMSMNFEGLAPLMDPDQRAGIDGLKARFDGKPITELVNSYREAERSLTDLQQRAAAPAEPSLEAYGITNPDGIAEDVWQAESAKAQEFINDAHAAGVTKAGFQSLYNRYLQSEQAAHEARETAARESKTAAQQALAKEWGTEYSAKLETTNNAFSEALQELGIERTDNPDIAALENNPAFIRYAHLQARKLAEATGKIEGSTAMPNGAVSSQVSGPELAMEIMSNAAHPMHAKFNDQTASGGGDVVDYVMSLRSKMRPTPPRLP